MSDVQRAVEDSEHSFPSSSFQNSSRISLTSSLNFAPNEDFLGNNRHRNHTFDGTRLTSRNRFLRKLYVDRIF